MSKLIQMKDESGPLYPKLEDTGWTSLNAVILYRKVGNVVTIKSLSQGNILVGNGSYTAIGTLPINLRPSIDLMFEWSSYGGVYNGKSAWLRANGNIELYLPSGSQTNYWGFTLTYLV